MYCKYCGKPLSDGARFCGFCGKEQTDKGVQEESYSKYRINISKQFIGAVCSIIINCAILLLCLTDLFTLTVNIINIYSGSTTFGVLDLFKESDLLTAFSYLNLGNIIQETSNLLYMWGLCICIVVLIYIVYLLDYVYSGWENAKGSSSIMSCKNYKAFSIVPFCFLTAVLVIGMYISSSGLESIGYVSPSISSIAIFILGAIQFVINRFIQFR